MLNERKWMGAVVVLLCCSGCAGTTWLDRAMGRKHEVVEPGDSVAQLMRLQKSNLAKFSKSNKSNKASSWRNNALTRGVKSATAKVSAALTIKPKVKKAPDPVRLAGNHEDVGYALHLEAGRFFENQGQFDRAQDQYQRALEKEPTQLETLLSSGRLFDRLGHLPQAEIVYQQAVAAHPQNAAAHNDLGLCYARQKKFKRSLAEFSAAIQIAPESKRYRNNIATVLVEEGRYDEAFSHFAQAHGEAIAHYNMGYLTQQKTNSAMARRHYEQSLQLNPDFAAARQALARLFESDTAATSIASVPTAATPTAPTPVANISPVVRRASAARPNNLRPPFGRQPLRNTPPAPPIAPIPLPAVY